MGSRDGQDRPRRGRVLQGARLRPARLSGAQLGHARTQAQGAAARVRGGHGHVLPEPRRLSPRGVPQAGASRSRCPGRVRAPAEAARLAAVDQRGADAHYGPAHRAPPAAALSPARVVTSSRSEIRMHRCRLLLLALCTPAAAAAQGELPRTHRPAPTVPAITPGDLMTRLYVLADDSMQGREAGTPGNAKATAYIAAEIKRAGLLPGGDDGTYFQTIPLKTRTFDTTSTFTVAGASLTAFTDYLALGPRRLDIVPIADPARNVVGIVPGSDPQLGGENVAIGAHNDHIGFSGRAVDHDSIRIWNHVVRPEGADDAAKQATPEQQARVDSLLARFRAGHPDGSRADSIANGADDDGSGSVAALEIAERIASLKRKPKRSILFVWHTGEEAGLWGSRFYTDHPTVPRDSIVAQLNMDMVGRGAESDVTGELKEGGLAHGGPGYVQLIGSRRLATELGDLIESVNRSNHLTLVFDYSQDANGHPQNIYCRSDHYEYARYGIPIVFFTTGGHADYHQVTDEPQYIDYDRMARVAQYIADLATKVANLDHRPVVDKPKQDPHGQCVQ